MAISYIWELVQKDGTVTDIPPEAVETVKKRWDNKDPIHLSTGSISFTDIVAFRPTSRTTQQPSLIEATAQAFDEPILTEGGEIKARWVKKLVTPFEYKKKYMNIPAYRSLGESNGMYEVAFALPIHEVDPQTMQYCSNEEIKRLQ